MNYIALSVEKEDVEMLSFPVKPIRLKTEIEQKKIINKLENANFSGHLNRNKVSIVFQDSVGLKRVNTTIFKTCGKNITIKKGVQIPVNRIVEIVI